VASLLFGLAAALAVGTTLARLTERRPFGVALRHAGVLVVAAGQTTLIGAAVGLSV
jgi:VIT1/CCC1 family predicted Fe2+/Mn2+ transporter